MWTGALRQPLSRGAERVCRLATVPRFATFEGSASDPVALMEPLSLSELSGDLFFRSVAGNPATWEITDGRCLQAGHGRALPEALTLLREVDMRRTGFLSALVSKASEFLESAAVSVITKRGGAFMKDRQRRGRV